jgi:hypothetical protein
VCVCVCRGHVICERARLQGPSATLTVTICGHRNPPSELIVCTGEVCTWPGPFILGVPAPNLRTIARPQGYP